MSQNEEIQSYKLGGPMSWEAFKAMPLDLEKEYYHSLRSCFHVTKSQIAEMMGVSRNTFSTFINKMGIADHETYKKVVSEQWDLFCAGGLHIAEAKEPEPTKYDEETDVLRISQTNADTLREMNEVLQCEVDALKRENEILRAKVETVELIFAGRAPERRGKEPAIWSP